MSRSPNGPNKPQKAFRVRGRLSAGALRTAAEAGILRAAQKRISQNGTSVFS